MQMDKDSLDLDEAGDFDRSKMSPETLLKVWNGREETNIQC